MADDRGGCFRKGCLGCLALAVIVILIFAAIVAIGVSQATREPDIRPIEESQPIPARAERPSFVADSGADPGFEDRAAPLTVPSAPIDVAEPGHVVLDVGMIDFRIRPAAAGTPIRVEGDYDAAAFRVDQIYQSEGELGWRYTLHVGRRGFLPRLSFNSDDPTRVTLYLPRDAPIVLSGEVGLGVSDLELGGLWLLDVDLEFGSGDHELSFDEPLAAPLASFRVDGSFGEFGVEDLGNASPVEARIEHGAGEVDVDLAGDWRADGEVSVRCGFGECNVHLPRSARVELDVPRLTFGESSVRKPRPVDGDADLPLVTVSVSASAGEVSVE